MQRNKFLFINNNITRKDLWRDGLLLNDGTYTFASNLVGFLNGFIFSKSIWLTGIDIGKDNCKQSCDSSDEIKQNNSINYNNIVNLEIPIVYVISDWKMWKDQLKEIWTQTQYQVNLIN